MEIKVRMVKDIDKEQFKGFEVLEHDANQLISVLKKGRIIVIVNWEGSGGWQIVEVNV